MTTKNNVFYYFSKEDKRLRYDDNRLIEDGIIHSVDGDIILCENGLHASPTPWDALQYAPGAYLWEVHLFGDIDQEKDKTAARHRQYIRGFDSTELLRSFARKQALINIHKIKPYTKEYALILQYLQTGDESLRDAAESAAESAARSAARSAAGREFNNMIQSAFNDAPLTIYTVGE